MICYNHHDKNFNIKYHKGFLSNEYATKIFEILEKTLTYYSKEETKVLIHGSYVHIPRSQVAYGDPNTFYSFTGIKLNARNWLINGDVENVLRELIIKIYKITSIRFNFVLINRYNDGKQHIGYHSDDERDLVNNPIIIGISLGGIRTMSFQHKYSQEKFKDIRLEHGSMIEIIDPTNKNYKHSILKTSLQVKPRISLTFRRMKMGTPDEKYFKLCRELSRQYMIDLLQKYYELLNDEHTKRKMRKSINKLIFF